MNIFEQLNVLLMEAENSSEVVKKDIPIHPEMETKEQGKLAAAEKIRKLFQKLTAGSGGGQPTVNDGKPQIPDDMIDPLFKEQPKSVKDKNFDKNKVTGWDEKSDEKVEKEVDVKNSEEDDEFDDFDYHQNTFGDDEEENDNESSDDNDDNISEDQKLNNSINDGIDSLNDENEGGEEDDDSGADWDGGEQGQEGGQEGGEQGQEGGEQGQEGGQEGGEQGQEGGQEGGEQGQESNSSSHGGSGKRDETLSEKQKRLENLKKSLNSNNMKEFNDNMDKIKNDLNYSDEELVGSVIETPTDNIIENDMRKAGVDEESIEKMTKEKNKDPKDDYTKEEWDKMTKEVVNGLERQCKDKGGSALASDIVKNSARRQINDQEWEKILDLFLRNKSEEKGNVTNANKGYKFGHKNHLWRKAVLVTNAPSKGPILKVYCFVDFSGSVDKDLVFTFLGKVVDLCIKLEYASVVVYGVGEHVTLPRIIDDEALEHGRTVAISQTWDYIQKQNPGGGTTNFRETAREINKIKDEDDNAVFLIFGDAFWSDARLGVTYLKYDLDNQDYFDDICMMIYYINLNKEVKDSVNILYDIVGVKHIITSKATSITN